ncbi:alkaline phosphatase, tissue-nonspecific isozyme-like [Haemaphysalis longicornis]
MTPEELPPGRTSTGSSTEEPTASAPSQPTPPRKPPTPVPGVAPPGEDRPEFWRASGQRTLAELLAPTVPIVVDAPAKNVILFVGDGMGVSTVTASRIYGAQRKNGMPGEESRLAFERFPFTALIKTYAADRQVVDSASSATALFTGVKTRFRTVGVSSRALPKDCDSVAGNEVKSFLHRAQEKGLATGLVTTTRITHATPAAAYAHSANRDWENKTIKTNRSVCKSIARQLVEDEPGKNLTVILGGGLSYFWTKDAQGDELSGKPDLITLWEKAGRRRQFVASSEELLAVDANKVDNLLGLFSPGHLPAEIFRTPEVPSLTDMVVAALKMLKAKGPGFALIVEGGLIDQAHHVNHAAKALSETVAMSDAIEAALKLIDYRETLFLVTADHSHGFTMNGYPPRGHPILGEAGVSNIDGLPYTTLMYNTGPSNSERIYGDNTEADDYRQVRNVPIKYAVHGGEDVALYGMGPMAHLVHGVLEQHVVAHIIHYAACLGDGVEMRSKCEERNP